MKITRITLTEKGFELRDYRDKLVIKIDGKEVFSVYDGEPKDNTLSKNFSDCYKITALMRLSYNMGIKREVVEMEYIEVDKY